MLGKKRAFPNGFERLWKNIDDVRLQNWTNLQKGVGEASLHGKILKMNKEIMDNREIVNDKIGIIIFHILN